MKNIKARILGILLCLTLVLGMVPIGAATADNNLVTREEAVASLLNTVGFNALNESAADLGGFLDSEKISADYIDEIGKAVSNGILVGATDKTLAPKDNITRLEFAVVISRSIRELPFINAGRNYQDVPSDAAGDVNRLVKSGLMAGYGDDQFGSEDYLTRDQLAAVLSRIEKLPETRLQDDFYYTVNYEWLSTTKLPAGYPGLFAFDEVNISNNDKLKLIAEELLKNASSYRRGTKEQKMADFYRTILDTEKRNKQGIEPIKKYLDRIQNAKSAQELLKTMSEFEDEIGFNALFSFSPLADLKDSSKYSLYGTGLGSVLPAAYYVNESPQIKALYTDFIAQMLGLAGADEEEAAKAAQSIYDFEKILAESTLSNELASKVENIYNPMTSEELDQLFGKVDLKTYMDELGYGSVENVIITDTSLMKKTGEIVSDENLDILKTYSGYKLIVGTAPYLSEELFDAIVAFNNTFLGVNSTMSDEDMAFNILNSVMSHYLGEAYVEKYFSEDAREDVESIAKEIIATYKKRIQKLDWMGDATKAAAILKLDSIKMKIGYPDSFKDPLSGISIKTYSDGGSLLGNIFAINSAQVKESKSLLSKPVDKTGWALPPQTVNAFYNATNNEITFPAGILQAPFYDVNATREQNLGGIGTVIAHEVTHAFDNNGAQFDKDGNMSNWWSQEDYENFQQKCNEVIALYNGLEIAPGAIVNGNLTVSENVADIGAMACILEIAERLPDTDYEVLFRSNANIWRMTATKQMYQYLVTQDVHAPNKFRVNQVLRNFDKFYETYGIKPGDGMYLAPKERVIVW